MKKIWYSICAILYVAAGFIFASGITETTDPFVQVLSTIALMIVTLGFVLTTLLFIRKDNET